MRKKVKFAIIFLIVASILIIVFYLIKYNKNNVTINDKKYDIENEAHFKDEDAYVDGIINSFFNIYSRLITYKDIDISYLSDVVIKDSNAFKVLSAKREEYLAQGGKYEFDNIIIENKSKNKNEYEYIIKYTERKYINENKKETKSKKAMIKIIYSENKQGIDDIKIENI
ncbi:hypothetical protein SAMN02745163_03315 [Clostridium cavendishii DSM 21758]|uniref:Uncharacterized protein n=1 Tax=Clostridium cavendishii DSM 21758 TaxID=1121302 RepID=A0A1M6Q8C0_9CLOT|nr:hypothetical protein [Clostridium cavendishii]SHK16333.1 hypothetical protein SAMN02745163_03315 [Clostridium cavendishii DSM 21758]